MLKYVFFEEKKKVFKWSLKFEWSFCIGSFDIVQMYLMNRLVMSHHITLIILSFNFVLSTDLQMSKPKSQVCLFHDSAFIIIFPERLFSDGSLDCFR